MAKTKKANGYAGNQKLSMVITGLVAILVGVILGIAIDNWQESVYEIGESEAIQDSVVGEINSERTNSRENGQNTVQSQSKNLNQNSAQVQKPVRQ